MEIPPLWSARWRHWTWPQWQHALPPVSAHGNDNCEYDTRFQRDDGLAHGTPLFSDAMGLV